MRVAWFRFQTVEGRHCLPEQLVELRQIIIEYEARQNGPTALALSVA